MGTPTFALVPPYVVPSANSLRSRFPPALYQHIMSRVPPPLPSSQDEMVVDPDLPDESSQPPRLSESDIPKDKVATNSASVHKETKQGNNFGKILNVEMRNRKWAWPGYLTFGKSGKSSSQASSPVVPENVKQKPPDPEVTPTLAMDIMPAVDKESLQDAISSHHLETPLSSGISPPPTPPPSTSTTTLNDGNAGVPFPDQESEPSTIDIQASPTDSEESSIPTCSYGSVALPITESEESNFPPHEEPAPSKPKPPLFTTTVHLADDSDPTATIRKKVLHITVGI